MKIVKKILVKLLIPIVLLSTQAANAQTSAVVVDPQLGQVRIVDDLGFDVDANNLDVNKVVSLKIPIINDNHGKALPAGSCKIKIGLGTKLVIDSSFVIGNANLNAYFSWSIANEGGQAQITGTLVNNLPPSVTAANVLFKIKSVMLGHSTITANFLITNHNTSTILSDENGNNNTSSLAYQINNDVAAIPTGEASGITVYPNPITSTDNVVIIEAKSGSFNGQYSLTLFDALGKRVQTNAMQLVNVKRFNYPVKNIAAGKYALQIAKDDAKPVVVKIEKLK